MAKKSLTIDDLRKAIKTHPLIDNHAHNLLRPEEILAHPFESITTEASGEALKDTFYSLSHIRAVKQLAELFDCEEDWAEILKAREALMHRDYEGLVKICLEGTAAILMDDGLDSEGVHPYKWHDRFCHPGRTKRIVRIEVLAQDILRDLVESPEKAKTLDPETVFSELIKAFSDQISRACQSDAVVGFKSVICYRSGLDITPASEEDSLKVSFHDYFTQVQEKGNYRVDHKAFNDHLVVVTLKLLEQFAQNNFAKPIQFHTGLGDSDISLLKSNPVHMQPLIEAFPLVDFVLLHSSYPYTREAGYLASTFKNVYLDIGEVFPMLSRRLTYPTVPFLLI
jgi:hypothetical protein